MSDDWTELRAYLAEDLARQIDDAIRSDPDRELRALLAANREQILKRMTDQAELVTLRRMLAEREHMNSPHAVANLRAQEEEPEPEIIKLNGGKRVFKVGQR